VDGHLVKQHVTKFTDLVEEESDLYSVFEVKAISIKKLYRVIILFLYDILSTIPNTREYSQILKVELSN
jgi:hypothetical protein